MARTYRLKISSGKNSKAMRRFKRYQSRVNRRELRSIGVKNQWNYCIGRNTFDEWSSPRDNFYSTSPEMEKKMSTNFDHYPKYPNDHDLSIAKGKLLQMSKVRH